MMRTTKAAHKTFKESLKIIKKAKNLYSERPASSQAFIADAQKNSESYQRIQKMRKTIESK